MGIVYVVQENGETQAMSRVHCQDEDLELQRILERNPDLLPGEQIDPEDPRRWLLIKREMPVPDPNTGTDRWSIDFLFCDQDAIPTFVECKRFTDTRSRREIVGQMLEYAANGHYYWTRDALRDFAADSAARQGTNIDDAVQKLRPTDECTSDGLFERVQQNLREGQLRIIFFLEESPMELRSVVDFLNKQMERSEVLLVEARQYTQSGIRVVAPTLFGYTEQARQVKRSVSVSTAATRRKWDRDSFFEDAHERLEPEQADAMEQLYEACVALNCDIAWGTGKRDGSFSVKESSACERSLLTVYSSGVLALNFHWLDGSESADRARQRLRQLIVERLGVAVPKPNAEFRLPVVAWAAKVDSLAGAVKQLVSEARRATE